MLRYLCGALLCLAIAAPAARAEQRIANVSQGTGMALALTPDGEWLIVDLLGSLWRLPAKGGGAEQLTPDDEHARHPRVSPDGRTVVYQRLLDGQWDLWLLDLESGERRALTTGAFDEREPDFSADGSAVVFVSNRSGRYSLWSADVSSGELTQLTQEPGEASFPAVSERGEVAYVNRNGTQWTLRVLTADGVSVELLTADNRLAAPTWRPGGDVLVYNDIDGRDSSELKMLLLSSKPLVKTLTRAEDVFAARVAWASPARYYYTADGGIWRRGIAQVSRDPVHMFAAVMVESRTPPAVDQLLDAPGPNPVRGVAGTSASEDGKVRVFTALGDLWLADRRGEPRRLTNDTFVDVDASVSSQSDFAVFASDRSGYMDLWRVTLPGGVLTQLTNRPQKAYRPAVSPDGRRVAFLGTDGLGTWGKAALRLLDLDKPGAPPHTLAEDLLAADFPRWDGNRDVAVQIRSSAASPSRDAILTIDVATGERQMTYGVPQPADVTDDDAEAPRPELEWRAMAPDHPYVIQVGRLFDGIRSDYRRHVDIHIENQRIVAIVGRGMLPLPDTVIDARDATVIPGLIDIHAHHSPVLGERLGRVWLAYGVTTVREVAGDVPAAVERAESWASGQRLGPRLIVSPNTPAAAETGGDVHATASAVVPIRSYSGLRRSSALFTPPGTALQAAAWPIENRSAEPEYLLRTSPLNLSYQDVFATLVESGMAVTSNLAATAAAAAQDGWSALLSHAAFRQLYSPDERAAWLGQASAAAPGISLQQNLVRLVRAGGRVRGSDAPAVPYGLGIHLELAMLAEAGLPADQVLRIATASNAMALGVERQIGTLEAGKLADLVVVDGNPLTNLADAVNVTAVVRGGVWLDKERLLSGP